MIPEPDPQPENPFISRELSWLDFNSRVLDEAAAPANPLLERLKFIAITSNNLDEFFMVRIARLRQMILKKKELPDLAGNLPSTLMRLIRGKLERELRRQEELLGGILAELEREQIRLRQPLQLPEASRRRLGTFFQRQIFPVLTPLAIDPSHPFPVINNGALELLVSLQRPGQAEPCLAVVEVPTLLSRFVKADDGLPGQTWVCLEDIIIDNLPALFAGCTLLGCTLFRITRDMNFTLEEDRMGDLLRVLEKKLLQRRQRRPVRLQLRRNCQPAHRAWLMQQFGLQPDECWHSRTLLGLKSFIELPGKCQRPDLLEPPWPPVNPSPLSGPGDIFSCIAEAGPILLAPPFHAFAPVVRLLEEAAEDPDVLAIKQTLYRVSGNSPVVRALQRAAENGKQVAVVVELKARFDEGNNIAWARRLEESGAHVVYGVRNLKVHGKALLVVRREEGYIRRYVHLATGNYNDKTAALYTDMGVMSCDPDLCTDISNLFNVMTGFSAPPERWLKIAVAPFNLRQTFLSLIDREIQTSTPEAPGCLIAKINALGDEEIMRKLLEAAAAGVRVDLLVRGACCLKPPRNSTIRIISIVDRYLEHTRLFYFRNGGRAEYYLSSADWLTRNLSRRLEILFPVESPRLCRIFAEILDFQRQDDEKGRRLLASGHYTRKIPAQHTPARSQARTYELLRRQAEADGRDRLDRLKVYEARQHPPAAPNQTP